jgi:excisionase family DNA binding protein
VIQPADLLTPDELAARLKVRKTWLYEKIRQKGSTFPYFRMGRYLRFSWAEVSTWVERTHRPARVAR